MNNIFVVQVRQSQRNVDGETDPSIPTKFLCVVLDPLTRSSLNEYEHQKLDNRHGGKVRIK